MMNLFFILTIYHHVFKYHHRQNREQEISNMGKKPLKKQTPLKKQGERKNQYSEKRQRHYAFGFLIGDY
jgi:hypothetical protein